MKPTTSFKLLGIIKDLADASSTLKRNFKDYIIGYHTEVVPVANIKKKLIDLKDNITNELGSKSKQKAVAEISSLATKIDDLSVPNLTLDKTKVNEILTIYIGQYVKNKKEENSDELQRVLNLKVTNDLYNYSETVFLNHYGNKNIELITINDEDTAAITTAITAAWDGNDSTELKTLIINIHTPKVPSLTSFWDQLTIKTGGNGSLDLAEVGLKSLAIKGSKNDYHINRFEKLIENITDNMFKWMDRNLPVNELHFPEVPLDLRVLLWRYIDEYGIGFFNESRGVSDPNSLQKRYNYYHRYALYQDESTWMSLLGEYNPSAQPKGYIQRATKWIGLEGAGWGRTLAIGSAAVGAGLLLSGPLGWAAAAAAAVA